jgi:cobalamin-dependent methionine synthase I
MSEELYKAMAQSIIDGESEQAVELAQKSIELNMHPLDTITKGFVVGVNYIGDLFGKGEAFLRFSSGGAFPWRSRFSWRRPPCRCWARAPCIVRESTIPW